MSTERPQRGLSPVSIAIGSIGLAALWLTQVQATSDSHVLDCGRFVTKATTINTIHGPCAHALGRRFALAFVVIVPTVASAWAVQLRYMGYLGGRKYNHLALRGSTSGSDHGSVWASYPLARPSATPEQLVVVTPVSSTVL